MIRNLLFENKCFYYGKSIDEITKEKEVIPIGCPYGGFTNLQWRLLNSGCQIEQQLLSWDEEKMGVNCNGQKYLIIDDISVKDIRRISTDPLVTVTENKVKYYNKNLFSKDEKVDINKVISKLK